MANNDLRKAAKAVNIPLWELADFMNISEPTMSRLLRRELEPSRKAELRKAIQELA